VEWIRGRPLLGNVDESESAGSATKVKPATTIQLNPRECREAMHRFYREQIMAEPTRRGVTMALPLMFPDGWQVQVHLKPLNKSRAIITDGGRTITMLLENGLRIESAALLSLLEERKRTFELVQVGFELQKEIALPLEGLDVQLFAESLVSIAHFLFRFEPE
jgi:hypothetical protein